MTAQDEVRKLLDQINIRTKHDPVVENLTTLIETVTAAYLVPAPQEQERQVFTPLQARIFELLASRPGRLCTFDALMNAAYFDRPINDWPDERLLKVVICHIRRRLALAKSRYRIESVWASGFKLVPVDAPKFVTQQKLITEAA